MAKPRCPNRDKAKEPLEQSSGTIADREIAAELGADEKKIAAQKQRDERGGNVAQQSKTVAQKAPQNKKTDRKLVKAIEQAEDLTEKEKAFCLHFVKTNNATAAVRAAGYETNYPNRIGWGLLQKPHIKAEVKRLRAIRNMDLLANADDVVEMHMRIAFADMGDFATWGRDGEDNKIQLIDSALVDGQLVSEVKVTSSGVSVKLADRQKSLSFLERYFELNPMDRHRKACEDAKLAIERQKAANMFPPDDENPTGVIALPDVAPDEGGGQDE